MKNLITIWMLFLCTVTYGQTTGTATVNFSMVSVARLDLETSGSRNFNFTLTSPGEAGSSLVLPSGNSTIWLNFTSAVTALQTRRITASVSGTIPAGISLRVLASTPVGGAGTLGAPGSILTLSSSAQTLVNAIGGAYTGNGVGNGFQLNYSVIVGNYALLRSGSSPLTVVYTFIDN